MNRKIYLIGMMILAMLFASCKKEEKTEVQEEFSIMAVTENDGSKTYLDGNRVKWIANTDVIKVFDRSSNAVNFTCKTVESTGTEANFTSTTPVDDQGEYWAFYPATQDVNPTRSGNTFTFTMPATQTYKEGNTFNNDIFPMAAHFPSGSKSGVKLQFKNAFGILKISATGNTSITSIVLTDNNTGGNNALSGNFTFNPDNINNNPTAAAGNNGNVMTLTISPAVTLTSTPKDFYMILPPGCLAGAFNLKFYNNTEVVKEINKTAPITNFAVERSKLKTANVDATKIPSFSVGNGVKVQFASGNLKSDNDGKNWGFQPNQWTHTGTQGEGGRGWFYYSNTNSGNNYGINYVGKGGTFVDWGNLFPDDPGWRTLSASEWSYLLFERANNLKKLSTVNYVSGIVLMPDGWTGTISGSYSESSWTTMEAAGAVFLPRTSSCVHVGNNNNYPFYCNMINFIGGEWAREAINGYYWSSTLEGDDGCYYFVFNAEKFGTIEVIQSGGQGYARAVRLVKNVN